MAWVDDHIKAIETVPDAFVAVVDSQRRALFQALLLEINRLDTAGGRIISSSRNVQQIEAIIAQLGFLFETEAEYLISAREMINSLGVQANLADEALGATRTPALAAVLEGQQFKVARLFSQPALEQAIGQELRNLVTSFVTSEADINDSILGIKDYIEGTDDLDAALTRYAKTWSSTAYANAERQYVFKVAEDVGVQRWMYVGGLVEDTRDFCIARAGKTFTTEEVRKWGEIPSWQGRMRGTDSNNIFERAGGWNCRHVLMPVV
jgi:hypothetical protein